MARGEEWRRQVRRAKALQAARRRAQKGRYRRADPLANAQPGVYYSPDRLRGEDDRGDDDDQP